MKTKSFLICLITILFFCQCKEECTELYMPVCGHDGQIYLNSCTANAAGVSFTEGLCTYVINGKVVNLGEMETGGCGWVFKIDSFFITPSEVIPNIHFVMHNLPNELKEHGLNVEITYDTISDTYNLCFVDELEVSLFYLNVLEVRKI